MTCDDNAGDRRLVKSVERVRDLGEVFTPAAIVQSMLDLIPADMWRPHPSATVLEPACGDGNFLVAILQRKLDNIAAVRRSGDLPAGNDATGIHFHGLEALASIYAVDISVDNVVGGTPGHEVGARDRLLRVLKDWHKRTLDGPINSRSAVFASASWIVEHNIQVGNMLPSKSDGRPSDGEALPLVEYHWDPALLTVTVSPTTLGGVVAASRVETTGVLSLFEDVSAPSAAWNGRAVDLYKAPIPAPEIPGVPASNGRRRG